MTWIPDLEPFDYLWGAIRHPRLLSVGWLAELQDYPRGPVDRALRDKLAAMRAVRWLGSFALGSHGCELCPPGRSTGDSGEINVPAPDAVYVAPNMIVHYIDAHEYRPPPAFLEAVERCALPPSEEFLDAFAAVCPKVLPEIYPPRRSWLDRWRQRRRQRRAARAPAITIRRGDPNSIVWEMEIAGGNRLFVDARSSWPGAAPSPSVGRWRDATREPMVTWIDQHYDTPRTRYLAEAGEQEPSIEDLVFTMWFLHLSSIAKGRRYSDERGIPIVSLHIETALGPVRFDRSQIHTGNFVRIVTRAGELLAMRAPLSNAYDAKCLTLRPDGEGLLRELGRI